MAIDRPWMGQQQSARPAELLELLGDEYAREVLEALLAEPRSGSDVAAETSVSKPTAFRRLNRLEEVGLVKSRQAIDLENGQHYREFQPAFDRISVELDGETLTTVVEWSEEAFGGVDSGEQR
ncbi:winged helix-turn-helix domain-containing protein [Halobacteria archaeon AArc-dxtr1]|nr:winged helix-turn-helix domain-containing protein [Halobacteria archaeon AArc-dxtr1]